MQTLLCEHLLTPGGWLSPGRLRLDAAGKILAVDEGPDAAIPTRIPGFVVPAMANLHSHAFQRALAGFVQMTGPDAQDSFWTWRTRMYQLAQALNPEDMAAIAAMLYVEMLEAGYTSVGEFHYVHHQPDGRSYDDPVVMSAAVVEAATSVGLPMTLLPVAYFSGGFDAKTADHQRRFVHADADAFLKTWRALPALVGAHPHARLGVAPHSLRAVPPDALDAVVAGVRDADPQAAIHVHVAEQRREVQDCLQHRGARPVQWLLDHQPVDEGWCLIHATHVLPDEIASMAARGAVAGLCPSTEADLGDGIFPAEAFTIAGGRWGVGTDSHAAVSVGRELALLEWGQRLQTGRRNVIRSDAEHSVGRGLYERAARDGARAIRQPTGRLAPGLRADFLVLDGDHPRLAGHGPETALDAWIFSGADDAVAEVWVAGQRRVQRGRHPQRAAVSARFRRCMSRLAPVMSGVSGG